MNRKDLNYTMDLVPENYSIGDETEGFAAVANEIRELNRIMRGVYKELGDIKNTLARRENSVPNS